MLLIKNFTKSKINKKFLEQVAKETIKNISAIKKIADMEIDLAIVGEKRIRSLNRTWRKKDKATDVLSFGNKKQKTKNKKNELNFIFPPNGIINFGQIFICYSVMARQARQYGYSQREEIARLLVHGILHLAGYNHEKNALQERKMFETQEKILKKIQ